MTRAELDSIEYSKLCEAVQNSVHYSQVLDRLGYSSNSGYCHKILKNKITELGISTDHFLKHRKSNDVQYLNNYIAIYNPQHAHAFGNGMVYVHIIEAEKMLGRSLTDDEAVHHIDGNKLNNDHSNLMIFTTNADHTSFHGGGIPYLTSNGTYKTYRKATLCSKCGREITSRAILCLECDLKRREANIPSKEQVEQDILTMNFVQIGEKYNVSDNAVRRWCKKYGLPYKYQDVKLWRKQHEI